MHIHSYPHDRDAPYPDASVIILVTLHTNGYNSRVALAGGSRASETLPTSRGYAASAKGSPPFDPLYPRRGVIGNSKTSSTLYRFMYFSG